MKKDKAKELEAIAKELAQSSCSLRKTATNPVPGEGNPDAAVMFIGEAPGKNEDLSGRPFVGAAGKVLESLLESIGLTRGDVFITSVEKFRPPANRDPKPEEIAACFPYLERQIKVIDPKVIVCLGRHALATLFNWEKVQIPPNATISKLHGQIFTGASGRVYFPMFHPAATLYGMNRKILEADFTKLAKILKD